MGRLTLADFRSDLELTFGDRNLNPAQIDSFINDAYFEIAGGIEFEELEKEFSIATVSGTPGYPGPTDDVAAFLYLINTSTGEQLQWVEKGEYLRLTPTPAAPRRWTRIGSEIRLWPTPTSVENLKLYYRTMPLPLDLDSSVTGLSSIWDVPIKILATHFGWMFLGEEARGVTWFNRFVSSVQSKLTEKDIERGVLGKFNSRFNTTPQPDED